MREWILLYVIHVPMPILFAAISAGGKHVDSELDAFLNRNVLDTSSITIVRVWSTLGLLPWPIMVRGEDQSLVMCNEYTSFIDGFSFEEVLWT